MTPVKEFVGHTKGNLYLRDSFLTSHELFVNFAFSICF